MIVLIGFSFLFPTPKYYSSVKFTFVESSPFRFRVYKLSFCDQRWIPLKNLSSRALQFSFRHILFVDCQFHVTFRKKQFPVYLSSLVCAFYPPLPPSQNLPPPLTQFSLPPTLSPHNLPSSPPLFPHTILSPTILTPSSPPLPTHTPPPLFPPQSFPPSSPLLPTHTPPPLFPQTILLTHTQPLSSFHQQTFFKFLKKAHASASSCVTKPRQRWLIRDRIKDNK